MPSLDGGGGGGQYVRPDVPAAAAAVLMGSKSRPRRLLISTALLSAIAIVVLVAWLYFFRQGSLFNQQGPPQPHDFPLSGDPEKGLVGDISNGDNEKINATEAMTSPTKPGISSAPVVRLRQGTYVGATLPPGPSYPRAVELFRGIPFAETTAGENRFRPPVPLGPSNETFQAVAMGQACPGSNATNVTTTEALVEGEDCLNLNVYRPKGAVFGSGGAISARWDEKPKLLPVIVYVHGGGFNGGVGTERNMASFVSWSKEPLIAINFNYRVGALGFLPSAVAAREGLLNLGLKDQQLLFAWVKDNVAEFGGDPDNVTVMGLSAGAHSIGHHLMYYATTSTPAPFHKAILESGATTARSVLYPTHPRHLVQFREFLIAAGIENTPEEEIFPTLRSLPVGVITNASRAIWNRYNASVCWPFQPVIDGPNSLSNASHATRLLEANETDVSGPIIPDLPITSWRQGTHLRIPVMTGFNTNEGTMFIPQHANTNEEFIRFFKTLIPSLRSDDLAELEALYPDPVTDPNSPYKKVLRGMGRQWARLDAAYSHFAYICPVLHTAHFLSTADAPSSRSTDESRPPVYIYRYAATATWGTANHGDEAPVVAHDMGVIAPHGNATRPGTHDIADAMHGAWVNFIVSGDPNPVRTPTVPHGAGKVAASSTTATQWAPFESPFARRRRRNGDKGDDDGDLPGGGRVMVFGEGNNEREAGEPRGRKRGIAAAASALSAEDMERCRFWWDRVELSQGAGRPQKSLDKASKL